MQRARLWRLWCAAVCAAAVLGVAAPSVADENAKKPAGDAALADLRHELAESSEAMVRAAHDLRRARRALSEARQAVRDARGQLAQARRRQQAAADRRLVAQSALLEAMREAEASTQRVTAQRIQFGRAARAAYQQGGSFGSVAVLLEADSPTEFTERLVTLDQVVTAQRNMLTDLQAAERTTKIVTYDFVKIRDDLAAAQEQAEVDADAIERLVARNTAAEEEVQRLVAVQEGALAAAMAARVEDERRLLELKGESDRLTSLLAAQAQALLGADGARQGQSYRVQARVLQMPVVAPVTSPFGMRVHPVTGVHKLHTGTDFGVACGKPIATARGGEVIAAGFNRAYGWRTVVSHGVVAGALLTTTYNHQESIGVEVGQRVKAGDIIGKVGTTGYSTGCHLHFELIINSDVVDPLPWLLART